MCCVACSRFVYSERFGGAFPGFGLAASHPASFLSFGQIYSREEFHHFIDGFNEEKSNWMRYVNPAHSAREQNLAACQNGMNIYFYTIKPIPANQELLVWYCRDFAERLHYPYPGELTVMNLSKWITEQQQQKNEKCQSCQFCPCELITCCLIIWLHHLLD